MDGSSKPDPYRGPFGVIRRVDDLIFTIEMGILWTFLAVSAVMVFLDVTYRRLAAPESKIGELIGRLFGVENPAALEGLDRWAPVGTAILGVFLLWFAFWTAEQMQSDIRRPKKRLPILYAAGCAAVLGLLGWIMLRPDVPSKYFYLLLYGLCAIGWLVHLARKRPARWPAHLLAFVVVSGLFIYIALNYFPYGYSWSKELSLILLLWVGFLGASVCAHEGKHIYMGAFTRLVPEDYTRWVHALGFLATALFCLLMAALGYVYAKEAISLAGVFEQTNIPDWVATIAVPFAFAMTMLRYLGATISALLGGTYGAEIEDESLAAAQVAAATGEETES